MALSIKPVLAVVDYFNAEIIFYVEPYMLSIIPERSVRVSSAI